LKRPQHTWHLQAILAELSDALNDGFAAICRRWTGLKTEIPQLQAKRERLSKKIRADSKECEERSQTLKALQTQIQLAIRSRDIKQAEATNFDAAAQDAQREFEEIFRRLRDLRADASLAENRAEAAQQQAENARKQRIAAQRLAAEAEASARLAQRQAAEANQALQHAQTLKRSAQDAQAEAEEKRHQMLEEHRTIRRRIANLNKQRAAAEQALVTLTNKDASASKTWSIALPIRQVAIGLLVMGVLTAWIVWMILRTVPVQEALIGIWKVDNEAMIEQLLADPIRAELSDGERQKAAISFKKAMADVRYEFVEDGRFIFTLAKGTRAEGAYTVKAINGKHFVIEGIKEDQSKPEQMNATLEGQQLKIEINGKKVFLVKQMRPFTGSADCSSQRATIR
jgi:hypothetical protein